MKRSKFSLSHYRLMSMNMGSLIPCGLVEVLPGDTIQHVTSSLVRCSPMLAPVMHPCDVRVHHWFVPHRIVWDDWEDFITGGPDGDNASVFPTIDLGVGGAAAGDLADYLGCPTGVANLEVSALPFRAYAKIYNEWYRDQDLVTELVIDTTDGADTTTNTDLQVIGWEKDYFTSARPWEQKGTAVGVGLSGTLPVEGLGVYTSSSATASANVHRDAAGTQFGNDSSPLWSTADSHHIGIVAQTTGVPGSSNNPQVSVDLANASLDVNDIREAMALQRFQEARARYGSRYVEYLRYLGVRSSDARLQRPEYLGGGRQTLQFSEVLQTAEGTNPVGEMRGHGITALRSNRYRRFFEEHGYVISLMSVRPKTIYSGGLPRTWNRRVKEDFWQRELQHMGQQEILNKELYAAHATPEGVFGYQDRYDEYRRQESGIAGEFAESTLNHWHLARIFGSDPALNSTFVECIPTERVFAVPSEDVLYVMANHSIQARRLVARTGSSHIF